MSLSARRRRRRFRLGLIFGVLALVAVGVVARYLMVQASPAPDPTNDPRRVAGMSAFEQNNPDEVLTNLGPYLQENASDTDALFAYASTQLRLAEDDPMRLVEATGGLRRVIRDQPNHQGAIDLLLPVFTDYPRGVEEEGLRIADRVLRGQPDHGVALKAKAVLLASTGRHQEAIAAAQTYLQQQPADVRVHQLVLDSMKRTNQPDTALRDYAAALRQADPQHPAFALVEAHAGLVTDDTESAVAILNELAKQTPPDTRFARWQIAMMDGANLFAEGAAYLERLHAEGSEALPIDELIRRRFEAGRAADTLALIESLEQRNATHKVLQVLSFMGTQKLDAAREVIAEIAATDGRANRATAALLTAAAEADTAGVDPVIEAARELRDAGVRSPYLDLIVAEAFEQAGQIDRAIARYESALRQRNAWATPCLGLAALHLSQDAPKEAVGYAVAALQRQPGSVAARILLVESFAADPAQLDARGKKEVLTVIDQVQQAAPGEPRTLAQRIAVLAGTGETESAKQALQEALAADPPLPQPAMVTLIEAAGRYGLDPEGKTQAAYVERFGQTLAITMAQAQRLIDAGDNAGALELFDQAMPAQASAEWDVNRALLLERLDDPRATDAWSAVGETYPHNLQVQQAQLRSAAAWADRDAIKQAIQRLRSIAGDRDTRWRIEQARWLLSSEDPVAAAEQADEFLDETLKIEPDSAEALSLRGRSQRMLGNPRLAISLLSQAISLSPNDANARAELAMAQRDAGSPDAALETARGAASLDNASPRAQRRAAQLMIDQAQYADAAGVLARLHESGVADARDMFTLAQLYRQTQQSGRALALLDELLQTPSPAAIALAADLYAQAGMWEKADAALAMLDDLELDTGDAQRIRATHFSSYADADTADAAWTALVAADPQDTEARVQLIRHRLQHDRTADAIAAARAAAAELSDHAGFAGIVQQAAVIDRLDDEPGMVGLAFAILDDDAHRNAAVKALLALDHARQNDTLPAALTDKLVSLAEASPDFESLWVLSVSHEFQVGRNASALARAEAAGARFPESAQSARLVAEAYGVAGRWREALLAAEQWIALQPGNRWEADVLAARAQREVGRASGSRARLSRYAESVEADPLARPMLTKELVMAWAANGRADRTKAVLEPLLSVGPLWRMVWLDVAVLNVSNTREAGRWLETLESSIPETAVDERGALAQAWWTLGMRDSYAPFRQRGREMAEQLTQTSDASSGLWFFVGSAAEVDQDLEAAERAYRRALLIDPYSPGANNNLAMVIASTGGDLSEAEAFARQAIKAVPNEPNYHDTLAFVLQQAGQLDAAREAIEEAIQLDPGNPAWRTRLNGMAVVTE